MLDLLKEQRVAGADVPRVLGHGYYHPNLISAAKEKTLGVEHAYYIPDLAHKRENGGLDKNKQVQIVKKALEPLRDCIVVNMFAGPGAGKSTLASGVYKELWRQGVSCELITEYAKDRVWEGSTEVLEDQLNVLGKQQHRQFRASKHYKVLITDSPILLSLYYDKNGSSSFKDFVQEKHHEYDNLNYYLERKKPYIPIGRYQKNIDEARKVDNSILDVLIDYKVPLSYVPGEPKTVDLIVDDVLDKLNIERKTDTIELPEVDDLLDVDMLINNATNGLRKCNVINFFGGPDVGKTAMAANAFHQLKNRGINCELVLSYAKEKFMEGAHGVLNNQASIFGKQAHRIDRVKDKVDIIITDAPLLQQLCYAEGMRESLKTDIREYFNQYNNYNFVLNRSKEYTPIGKMEDIEEAMDIDNRVLRVLTDNEIEYRSIL